MFAHRAARILAQTIFAEEASGRSSADECVEAVKRVHDKLASELSAVMGESGFDAMFARAVRKTGASAPSLSALAARGDAAEGLEGLWKFLAGQERARIEETAVTLLATFFDLLATIVGDDLAFRMFHGVWPAATTTVRSSAEK
jgi:hypothetical protein